MDEGGSAGKGKPSGGTTASGGSNASGGSGYDCVYDVASFDCQTACENVVSVCEQAARSPRASPARTRRTAAMANPPRVTRSRAVSRPSI